MMLSKEDRDKFAAYLEESAGHDAAIAEQAEKINQPTIAKKYRAEAMAQKIVAMKLRSIEDESVG